MAVLENLLPPVPADAIIALAAFLSHRGETEATTVYAVTWVSNVLGAGLVYLLARRWGRPFFASRLGHRLVTPEAVVAVERGYLRLGLVGLFLARLLPGFRSFTAAFAGIVRLGPIRAFLPIALAIDFANDVFPTPGGPTKHSIGPLSFFVSALTAKYHRFHQRLARHG